MNRQQIEARIREKENYIKHNEEEIPLYQRHVERRVTEIAALVAEIAALKVLLIENE